jgi:hypothetical protein
MQRKYILYLVILLILLLGGVYLFVNRESIFTKGESNTGVESLNDDELNYLLDGYPLEQVPLYKVSEVSSSKYIINFDPKNTSYFDHTNFAYYNVVFYTDASQSEFLEYYKGIFDKEVVEEYPIPDMVKGEIGKYRVSAAHYGSDDTAYVQVYIPNNEFTKENMYFDTYPNLFEEDDMFVEHENSYGLLNQVGGQTEYTKYFTVIDSGDMNDDGIDDVDEFGVLKAKYEDMYKGKTNYGYDEKNNLMSWDEDGYEVRVSFTRDHGRIYLNIRGSITD